MKIIRLLSLMLGMLPIQLLGQITGKVTDRNTGDEIIGAKVTLDKGSIVVTDIDGKFAFPEAKKGKHSLSIEFFSYTDTTLNCQAPCDLTILLSPVPQNLNEVEIVAKARLKSDLAIDNAVRESQLVTMGIGSDAIKRTQDRDAGEVVRRLPGISILNEKFIIARGLSQRYNNVWVNNAPVPSSEADTRSFSFDLIPSGQIENIMVFKSPAPEIPADFTGGFVKITTRDLPDARPLSLSLTGGYNTQTTFKDFLYNPDASGSWLKFSPKWVIKERKASPDIKFMGSWGHQWDNFTLNGSLNFSRVSQRFDPMLNARYGIYNFTDDRPEFLYDYTDRRFQTSIKWGTMLNLGWTRGHAHINFRNIFNHNGESRLTLREGWQNISSRYDQEKTEYQRTSRNSYCGQLAGFHPLHKGEIDWEGSFSYADKNQPDRRIINRQQNDIFGDKHFGQMQVDQNDIQRDFTQLHEYMASGSANYNVAFGKLQLKTGALLQYRSRDYRQKSYYYRFDDNGPLGKDFGYGDPVNDILLPENMGPDKLYLFDETDQRDSYDGHEWQWGVYGALTWQLPNNLSLYGGVRAEQSKMTLSSFTMIHGDEKEDKNYDWFGLYPSLNLTWGFTDQMQLRGAYGMSTNRPEFREVSPSVYYDFELFSDIKGNPNLKAATVQNADVRWEWYMAEGENLSIGGFYKYFKNPIENTFLDAGGSYTYTFENANSAWLIGAELDLRKRLDFISAPWLVVSANLAFIHSRVNFSAESLEHNRQMQGQSPYIINMGMFYQPLKSPFSAGLAYNRIGKRIVGIGRTDMSVGGSINNDIPDMYEMPRNSLDLVASFKFAHKWEIRFNAKDILNERVEFCQFPRHISPDGQTVKRKQVTRSFKPGVSLFLSLALNM